MNVKKFPPLALAIVMLLSITNIPAFASDSIYPSESYIDSELVLRGYPQIVLDEMSFSAKQSIYNDKDLFFKGAAITTYDQQNGTFENYEISSNGTMPLGQIPTSDLSLVWSINGDRNDASIIKVVYSYSWIKLPIFRWQDPIAVSWDDALFEMKTDSFYKVDQYNALLIDTGTGEVVNEIIGGIQSEEHGYAQAQSNGVTWYADLKGYWGIPGGMTIMNLYGHGEFELEKKTSASGTSKIYGYYVHPTVSTSLSINIGDAGNFTVSGIGQADERGNQATFSY